MTTVEIIGACKDQVQLPFLIIGGLAIVAHGYQRDTLDLDYLARQSDRAGWRTALDNFGYTLAHHHEHFDQFASTKQWIDLDIMYVNEGTFDKMFAASELKNVGRTEARFPSLAHLIALKLHVLKQNIPHRMLGDTDDVINLVLANQVDLRQENWKQLFERYGNLELYERIARATSR